jgi:hypothetical protein
MKRTKNIQGKCEHCGMSLEFAAESIGSTTTCPYCHRETELTLHVPEVEPTIPKRLMVWTIITVVVLVLGLIGAIIALNRAQSLATEKRRSAPAQTEPGR